MAATAADVCAQLAAICSAERAIARLRARLTGSDAARLPPQAQEMVARVLGAAAALFSAQQVAAGQPVRASDAAEALEAVVYAAQQVGVAQDTPQQQQERSSVRLVWCRKLVDETKTVGQLAGGNNKTVLRVVVTTTGDMPPL